MSLPGAARPARFRPAPGQPVPGQPVPGQPVPGLAQPGRPAPGHPARAGRRVSAAGPPLADVVALGTVAVVAGLAGWPRGTGPAGGPADLGGPAGAGLLAGYLAVVFLAASACGLHRLRITPQTGDQAGRAAAAALLPSVALLPAAPAGAVFRLALGTAAALVSVRAAGAAALRAARRRGWLAEGTVLAGAGPVAGELAALLASHPELGLRVLGCVAGPGAVAGGAVAGGAGCPGDGAGPALPVLGSTAALAAVVARTGASRVIVTGDGTGAGGERVLARAVREARTRGADVCVLPRLAGLGAAVPRGCLDEIWGVALIPLRRPGPAAAGRAAKRALDLVVAAVLLLATAPLLAVAALAVRWRLRRPALFRQIRVVGAGREAEIVKLRTMVPRGDPDTCWAVPGAACGRLGRFLRITHLDELPQLGSVLRGDMSLAGPRPERPHFARRFAAAVPGYAARDRMPAGLTGWAQVHGLTGDTSIADRARFDNYYIEYWSLWLDLIILARTVTSTAAQAARWVRPRRPPPGQPGQAPGASIGLAAGPAGRDRDGGPA